MNNAGRLSARFSSTLVVALIAVSLHAQAKPDLASLSVDDLMNVEVTSLSRKGQRLSDTAAAVFVITQDDIHRSGATSIPEILRMVPGLNVARVNGSVWAITARGFNGRFANKLLVMIDGRSVYSPLFSGVFWDVQDMLLDDVDRIEVIRGPGGTLWGANAVNGIINIMTRHAIDTQGALVSAGGGAAEGSTAAARYGGSIGRNGYYRAWGKTVDRPASIRGTDPTEDAWALGRAGFRADWTSRTGENFMMAGNVYRGTGTTVGLFDPAHAFADRAALDHVTGQNLQFRWTAVQSSRSDTTFQAFYDDTARSQPTAVTRQHTFDLDFQHHLKISGRNDAVWGAAYRRTDDRVGGLGLALVRNSNVTSIASGFIQDEIQIAHRFHVTAGTKLEYGDASHLQLQPTLRILFKASESQAIWASATSAVRTASEIELYGRMNVGAFADEAGNTGLVVVTGNHELKPERVESYEAGYRWQVAAGSVIDATAFHNRMRHLFGTRILPGLVDASGRSITELEYENEVHGTADGAELLLTETITPKWNVTLGYSMFQLSVIEDNAEAAAEVGNITTPRHQLQLRSFIQLPRRVELDTSAYYVGRTRDVASYLRLDAQLSWYPAERLELSISGQNLLHARHAEYVGTPAESDLVTPIQRTVNGKVTWRF